MSQTPRLATQTVPGHPRTLSYSQILAFWLPLALMWVMMAVEQPGLNAVIARLPAAEINLAAFGVMFALSLVVESPIIQMLSTATALAGNAQDYRLLLRFMHIMAIALTSIHLLIGLTPLYDLIVAGMLRVPPEITETSRVPFIIMAPFSATVGYRRLWQGTLIRHGKTWIVPVTMMSRLAVMAAVVVIGLLLGRTQGARLAATAYAIAVTAAAAAAGILHRRLVKPVLAEPEEGVTTYTWSSLLRFYVPLALTTMIFLASQPMVTFGITRSLEPIRSLAVFPVVNSYLFIFSSMGISYQETAIALLNRSPGSFRRLSRFTMMLAASLSGLILLTGLTPVGAWWFRVVAGLDPGLLQFTRLPVILMAAVPGLVTAKAWLRARYVTSGRTSVLAQGVVVYTVVLFASVFIGPAVLPLVGVTLAAIALTLSQVIENIYLFFRRPGQPATSGSADGEDGV